jgi:hypothetical protein
MYSYRVAGHNFCLSHSVEQAETLATKDESVCKFDLFDYHSFPGDVSSRLVCCIEGWVVNADRHMEVYNTDGGMLVKIEGSDEFLITPHGEAIYKRNFHIDLTTLERDVILGPILVLALALGGTWSLHASAALFQKSVIAFLGESGQGKSTLASYLSKNSNWNLVADDILPVKMIANEVNALPHFPQLKLPVDAQPGPGLPEQLLLNTMCVLKSAEPDANPDLKLLPPNQAIQVLLRHTAGTRMFTPEMLGQHLHFCAQAVKKIPVYELAYPHRRNALPTVMKLLESIC